MNPRWVGMMARATACAGELAVGAWRRLRGYAMMMMRTMRKAGYAYGMRDRMTMMTTVPVGRRRWCDKVRI